MASAWLQKYTAAINRLAKWRQVLCGWQLGTRSLTDPEAQAVRDQREGQLILRAELTALIGLCLRAKVMTDDEFYQAVVTEATQLEMMLERKFPGFKSTEEGIEMDVAQAAVTTKHWRK